MFVANVRHSPKFVSHPQKMGALETWEALRLWRERMDWDQRKLAEKLSELGAPDSRKITRDSIAKWEANKEDNRQEVPAYWRERLARLGFDPEAIIAPAPMASQRQLSILIRLLADNRVEEDLRQDARAELERLLGISQEKSIS